MVEQNSDSGKERRNVEGRERKMAFCKKKKIEINSFASIKRFKTQKLIQHGQFATSKSPPSKCLGEENRGASIDGGNSIFRARNQGNIQIHG
mmetsp:Transcript_65365/g.75153  ORF Transcript_65365/g.75153 Transcript_65365/m.75153 type:complete len:92 (+) Transcript_65365:73-348(+)